MFSKPLNSETDDLNGIYHYRCDLLIANSLRSESMGAMFRETRTGFASVETTLELWVSSLLDAKRRMVPLFAQERSVANAGLFLGGLLNEERLDARGKGDPGPSHQQALLGRDLRNADKLRDLVREYIVEHLWDAGAVLVIDEPRFLKQGVV